MNKRKCLCHIFIQISVQHYALQVADRPLAVISRALPSTPTPVISLVLSYANINKNNDNSICLASEHQLNGDKL